MLNVEIKNSTNQPVGQATLDEAIFAAKVSESLVWEDVRHYMAVGRQGTASTKTRGEVSGGGKKPWKQKGTGRARHASIRSPIWRGGGIVFGPKPRDYSYNFPQKKRWGALKSVLTQKVKDGALTVVESLDIAEPKSKAMAAALGKWGLAGKKVLLVDDPFSRPVELAARNLPRVAMARPLSLRSYHVLYSDVVVMTKKALDMLQEKMPR